MIRTNAFVLTILLQNVLTFYFWFDSKFKQEMNLCVPPIEYTDKVGGGLFTSWTVTLNCRAEWTNECSRRSYADADNADERTECTRDYSAETEAEE